MEKQLIIKIIKRFVIGMFFGAVVFGCIVLLGFHSRQEITMMDIIVLLFFSGCMGELSAIFSLDINFLPALAWHFVGTLTISLLMFTFNDWQDLIWQKFNKYAIGFLVTYVLIWQITRIDQRRKIRKINLQLHKRKTRE